MSQDQNSNEYERYIRIWEKAVDTQMHFNEMSVKSRQLGLTFVAAALGVAVVLLSKGDDFSLTFNLIKFDVKVHISVVLLLSAWLGLQAVRILDLSVYHRMLRGAVTFGEDFEESYMKKIFDLDKGMTQAISHYSRFDDAEVSVKGDGTYAYKGEVRHSAEKKIRRFYRRTMSFLWVAAVVLFVVTNLNSWAGIGLQLETDNSVPATDAIKQPQSDVVIPKAEEPKEK